MAYMSKSVIQNGIYTASLYTARLYSTNLMKAITLKFILNLADFCLGKLLLSHEQIYPQDG